MTAIHILRGLEALELTGPEADAAARLGFLEWAFSAPADVTPDKAVAALKAPEAQNPESAAAQAFVGFLQQARVPVSGPRGRMRRTRCLH